MHLRPWAHIAKPWSTVIASTSSGQIPLDPATGKLVNGDIDAQTRRVLDNIRAVLEAAGQWSGQSLQIDRIRHRSAATSR